MTCRSSHGCPSGRKRCNTKLVMRTGAFFGYTDGVWSTVPSGGTPGRTGKDLGAQAVQAGFGVEGLGNEPVEWQGIVVGMVVKFT